MWRPSNDAERRRLSTDVWPCMPLLVPCWSRRCSIVVAGVEDVVEKVEIVVYGGGAKYYLLLLLLLLWLCCCCCCYCCCCCCCCRSHFGSSLQVGGRVRFRTNPPVSLSFSPLVRMAQLKGIAALKSLARAALAIDEGVELDSALVDLVRRHQLAAVETAFFFQREADAELQYLQLVCSRRCAVANADEFSHARTEKLSYDILYYLAQHAVCQKLSTHGYSSSIKCACHCSTGENNNDLVDRNCWWKFRYPLL